jgi:GNAT acetyltransferase-like protein/acetyltransferase (GNAT) family protein
MANFRVSTASAADLRRISAWAAEEGWNPGDDDAAAFFPTDPHGFLVGRLDGEPITSISAIRYGDDFGFIGLYIARPEIRGRGYGLRTWKAGLELLAGRTIGLDGVSAQQDNYRQSGFRPAWTNIRYQGVPGAGPVAGVTVSDAKEAGFDVLAGYDRRFFPAARDAFLAGWIARPEHRALIAVRDGDLVGLGVLRPARDAPRVGPLYAADAHVAEALLHDLTRGLEREQIVMDVPSVNEAAVDVAERLGLKPLWETARMYTGPAPDVDRAGIYAVSTLELG